MLTIIILSIVVIIVLGSYYFSNRVLNIKMMPIEKNYECNIVRCKVVDEEEYNSMKFKDATVNSQYKYPLNIRIYETENDSSNKYMIFSHGVTDTQYGSAKYLNFFLELGYNCITYNHRRHGGTQGKFTTYGWTEKYDLKSIVDYVKKGLNSKEIGLHGVSMGATIILQFGEMYGKNVDFFISDCAFSNFYDQLAHRLKIEYKLPPFPLINVASFFTKLRAGFYISEIVPVQSIKKIQKPVLIIHNKGDNYIPFEMAKQLFESKVRGKKKLLIFENGDHGESYEKNQKEYENGVKDFLRLREVINS